MDLSRFHIEKNNALNLIVTNAGVLDNFLIRISNLKTVGRGLIPYARNIFSSNVNATGKYEINGSSITTVTSSNSLLNYNFNNIQYGYVDYIYELVGSQSVIKTDASFFAQNDQGQWVNHVIKGRSLVHGTFISENYLRIANVSVANGTRIQVFKL